MITGITTGSNTADGSRCSARARVNALVAVTGLVGTAVGMVDTLAAATRHERIAKVSSATEADGSIISTAIGTWLTVGVNSARVRVTQITFIEWATTVERMASVSFRTRANSLVVLYATLGSNTASVSARIDALEIKTSLRIRTLFVLRALGIAASERISEEIGRARADSAMIADVTIGVGSARAARVLATEIGTSAIGIALGIGFALTSTALDWITHPSVETRADGAAVFHSTFCICSAWSWVAEVTSLTADHVAAGRWSARDKRITGETARALANGHVIPHVTFSIHTARCRARIDTTEVVTDFVAGTFGIFNALGATTSSVWITLVTRTTLADGTETASQTLGIGTAAEARARITAVAKGIKRIERAA